MLTFTHTCMLWRRKNSAYVHANTTLAHICLLWSLMLDHGLLKPTCNTTVDVIVNCKALVIKALISRARASRAQHIHV
jgi:hypothetical protein